MATSDDTGSYIGTADPTQPEDIDNWNKGAAEIRQAKTQSANTFPNFVGAAMTCTEAELNQLDGVTVGGTSSGDIATIDDAQTLTNKTIAAGSNTPTGFVLIADTDASSYGFVVDEDDMSSDSAAKVPTQQSVKSYVDGAAEATTIGTPVATTSGTAQGFTSLPAEIKEVVILLNAVSTDGNERLAIQIGDSGGYENTGYDSTASQNTSSGQNNFTASTAGFVLNNGNAPSSTFNGSVILRRLQGAAHTWVATGLVAASGGGVVAMSGGTKTLSAELDRVQITTTGSDTFDNGSIGIHYR